jgi:hypothetical protein
MKPVAHLILTAIVMYIAGYLVLRSSGKMATVGYNTDKPLLRTDIPYASGETLDSIYVPMLYIEWHLDSIHFL